MLLVQILVIIALTMISAYFSCSEVSFFSLPASKVRGFRTSQDPKRQQVARLLARSKSLLVTIFIYNTISNVLLQNASSDLFVGGWLLKVGIPLTLVLIVGELIPKYLGLIYNERIALKIASSIEWLEWIIAPLRIIVTKIAYMMSRLFFFFLKPEPPLSKEELAHILTSSEGKGILHKDERELINSVLNLEEKQINEIMNLRNEMPIYSIDEPLSKLIYLFSENKLSEVGLFEMPQEKMLGVIRLRDFFLKKESITQGKDLLKILRKPFYVPETTSAGSVLEQLGNELSDTAWIVDEYGQACGSITEQELLSHVAGTSYKSQEEKAEYERINKDTIVASGTLSLDEVRALFNVKLASEHHMLTIGGFITEKLGTIPPAGVTLTQEDLFIRILAADPTRIKRVYIQKRQKHE